MACDACGGKPLAVAVPPPVAAADPDIGDALTVCPDCLATAPGGAASGDRDGPPPADPTTLADRVGALPADPTAAVALALAVDRCRSLAVNRDAVTALLDVVTDQGHDPLLALDRLASDPSLDPVADLDRRLAELERLLE